MAMVTLPQQGGLKIRGDLLNQSLTTIQSSLNGTGTGATTISPDLTSFKIDGVAVTVSASDINGSMASWVLGDGDGTKLQITNGKKAC